ncbi:MAG: hypothetical protein KAQ99_03470, partial [Candidatus Aureabacteria bacterium]|nr:hypothetical protein [Candidatus Auribacterota bacterium]
IDDARYIATLKETIKKARQFNDKDLLVLTDESEQYLHGILDKIPLNFHRQQGGEKANREVITCLNGNIGTLDVWRAGIADRIIKLLGTMNNLKLMAQ